MSLYERIKSMTEDEMCRFLFKFQIQSICGFMTEGGAGGIDGVEMAIILSEEAPSDPDLFEILDDHEEKGHFLKRKVCESNYKSNEVLS